MEVPLNDIVLIWIEIFHISGQKDSSTLGSSLWLWYKGLPIRLSSLFSLISKVFLELAKLCWQKPCLGEEFVILWVYSLHTLKVPSEMVLPCQGIHTWEMIDTLIRFHAVKLVYLNSAIGPHQIPLIVWIRIVWHVGCTAQSHFETFSNVSDNIILCLWDI